MKDHRIDILSKNSIDGEMGFAHIVSQLSAREKSALETIGITTVEAFCGYDFTRLYAVRGYGGATIRCLQKLQRQVLKEIASFTFAEHTPISFQTSIYFLRLAYKEVQALRLLGIANVEDFLEADLSKIYTLKGYGDRTYHLLTQSRERIIEEISVHTPTDEYLLMEEHAFTLALNPRERTALQKLQISSLEEFARLDFQQMEDLPNVGAITLQSLLSKQNDIRLQIISQKLHSLSAFSLDDEFSVLLLDMSQSAKEFLWQLGITRISEFINANFFILELASSPKEGIFHELQQIKIDLRENLLDEVLNDLLSPFSLHQLGLGESHIEILRCNNINTFQDFLFFTIPEEHTGLRQIQFEWRSRYTPSDLLLKIPAYYSICFHQQKNKIHDPVIKSLFGHFTSIKHLVSASFEDIVKLAEGDLSATQGILSLQYETLNSCLEFRDKLKSYSVSDEREHDWMKEITPDVLHTLPFFSGRLYRGFTAVTFNESYSAKFHESYLPSIELDRIVRGRKLRQAFSDIDISSLGELLLTPQAHLLQLKIVTKDIIHGIQARIRELLLPPPPPPLDKTTPDTFLASLLKRYVKSEQAIEVFLQRVRGKTLKSLGEIFGLTRERIRQLEIKCKNPVSPVIVRQSFLDVTRLLKSSIINQGDFAHIQQITKQFAEDNGWDELDCSIQFVEFLLERVTNEIECYGNGYYSIPGYPCKLCGQLNTAISNYALNTENKYSSRNKLFTTLSDTCCSKCHESPCKINESFLNWKCLSDPLLVRLFGDENIYRSEKRTLRRMVFHILKESQRPLTRKEIHSIICQRVKDASITEKRIRDVAANLCVGDKDIFLWDRGSVYAHRKHIPTEKPLFTLIEERLKQVLKKAKTPYISLYALYNEFKSECEEEGIPSAHTLHACLKARNIPNIAFMRSPCVSATNEKHERKNIELLNSWIVKHHSYISRKSLERYAHEIGIDSHRYFSVFANLKHVIRYEDSLIVHLHSLEWNQQKQETFLDVALNYWLRCISRGGLFARADELLSEREDELPELANGIQWTSDLVFSLLFRSDCIVTYGNTHIAFGFKKGKTTPRSFGDIAAQILRDKFGGGAKLSDFSDYLRDDLKLIRRNVTPTMIASHPEVVVTKHEIYLSGDENAS